MRLRHLEVFRAVMLTGSVSDAARMLGISQPAASRTLQHAEMHAGFRLFQRSRGRLSPTPEADALYAAVTRVYRKLEQTRRFARNLRNEGVGHLRVATTPSLSHNVVPLALRELRALLPDLSCEIQVQHTSQIVPALLAQEIDIAFAFNPVPHEGIAQGSCGEGEIVVMGAPGSLEAGGTLDLAALARAPFIMLHDDTSLGYAFNRLCDEAGLELDSSITVQTYHMARGLAEQGLGIGIADQFTALAGNPALLELKRLVPRIGFEIHAMHNMHTAPSIPALKMIECVGRAAALLNEQLDAHIAAQAARRARGAGVARTRAAKAEAAPAGGARAGTMEAGVVKAAAVKTGVVKSAATRAGSTPSGGGKKAAARTAAVLRKAPAAPVARRKRTAAR